MLVPNLKLGRTVREKAGEQMKCTAIVLAAGQGKRMNSNIQKQFLMIKRETCTLLQPCGFSSSSPEIEEICLVTGRIV